MKIKQDGGYAWIVCAASFFHHVIQGGILLSVGIFYIMFKRQIDGSPSTIALVPSLSLGFFFIVGKCSFRIYCNNEIETLSQWLESLTILHRIDVDLMPA